MTSKVLIGGAPVFDNPFSDCTFLGRLGGYDLYFTHAPGKAPDVLARSGSEPGEYVEGLKHAWGGDKYLTAARRIAEYKKLLPCDPVRSLLWAHEPEDLASIRRALPGTREYAVLTAHHAGDVEAVNAGLDELTATPLMMEKYPTDAQERLRHVDMNLYLVGRFLGDFFAREVYTSVAAERLGRA